MKGIYLDHAASAPLLPEVAEAMLDAMRAGTGNPSSLHAFGRAARARLTDARDRIAAKLNCKPSEIVFTSGGTESDNAAVIGAARALGRRGKTHVVVSAIEHHAVLHAADALEREGFAVTRVMPDSTGYIDPAAVEEALRPETGLASIMWANNEVGTIQPIHRIGERLRARGIVFHVDAVQALGAVPIDLKETPAPSSASRRTSWAAPRESAPSTSPPGRRSSRSSTAVRRSGSAGPARRTWPPPADSRSPSRWRWKGGRRRSGASWRCGTGSRRC